MAKLYFRYGAMGCGKTRDLIKTWYNYNNLGRNAIILKPIVDTKADDKIQTRAMEEIKVDFLIKEEDNIYQIISNYIINNNLDCILVDEAQFLSKDNIDSLSDVVDILDIPVICYGLRADFRQELFTGSKRLFEIADSIEEMKTICKCGKKATNNVRFIGDEVIFEGEQIAIDGIDASYKAMCRKCLKKIKRN